MKQNSFLLFSLLIFALSSCRLNDQPPLPILGEKDITFKEVNGKTIADTAYYQIPDFSFYNQDSLLVTAQNFENKVYVADFFFTSCPTICPVMKKNMLKIQEAYAQTPEVMLISHSIDPVHDTVMRLRSYGERMGIDSQKWYLVTGDKDAIYKTASDYMVSAAEDESAPGGYIHSGALVLIDQKRRIRGYYDGTIDTEVDALIRDIKRLL